MNFAIHNMLAKAFTLSELRPFLYAIKNQLTKETRPNKRSKKHFGHKK